VFKKLRVTNRATLVGRVRVLLALHAQGASSEFLANEEDTAEAANPPAFATKVLKQRTDPQRARPD